MTRWDQAEVQEVRLAPGTVRYREMGTGDPVVLVHGLLANGLLWREVAERLAADFRVIVPEWPLGAHELPLEPGADLTAPGMARLIAQFLEALDLRDVTLVGNDTGGALCQIVAVEHPERIGRLVLTPCDAYDNFLPKLFKPLQMAARVPGSVWLVGLTLRPAAARRLPLAFGWLSKRISDDVSRAFVAPGWRDRRIRRDIAGLLKAVDSRYTEEAARRLHEFDRPVLVAWAPEDKVFPFAHAERLAASFPDARLERIEDSYTFVSLDQPARTADLIAAFAREPTAVA